MPIGIVYFTIPATNSLTKASDHVHSNMIEYLNIFVQVVEQGSFTRAADILQIHRPTVSKAIQQIEDDLGVKLIHRTTRKLSVTAEGEAFYHRARLVLSEVNDMMASFSPTLPPRGRLRIDVPLALAHAILIPNLKHFQSLYPDIDVILVSSDKKPISLVKVWTVLSARVSFRIRVLFPDVLVTSGWSPVQPRLTCNNMDDRKHLRIWISIGQ